jgi:hypothetical protein
MYTYIVECPQLVGNFQGMMLMFGSTKIETGNSNKEVVKDGPLNLNDIGHSYGNSTDSPQAKVQLAQNVFR